MHLSDSKEMGVAGAEMRSTQRDMKSQRKWGVRSRWALWADARTWSLTLRGTGASEGSEQGHADCSTDSRVGGTENRIRENNQEANAVIQATHSVAWTNVGGVGVMRSG